MAQYSQRAGLRIDTALVELIENEIAPGTGVELHRFWEGYAFLLLELAPVNRRLLARRDELQGKIDDWHRKRRGARPDVAEYRRFLREIGYLVEEGPDFRIDPRGVDPEIALVAGPQLVVPVMNARFALNAANARWGSLYDALYGTDAVDRSGVLAPRVAFNQSRADEVVRKAAAFLDTAIPLAKGSHLGVLKYEVRGMDLVIVTSDNKESRLARPSQWIGTDSESPSRALLFVNNGLHIELVFDPASPIGSTNPSGLADVVVESALTAIQDCEDSVAAVDAADKVAVYRNWLGLMTGKLKETVVKGGRSFTRRLSEDRRYRSRDGETLTLPGRSLLLVRNVGHLMTTDAVLNADGAETPEGILDALVTSFCALHDLMKQDGVRNSRAGSIYIVKPKMHGPEEIAFTDHLFDRVEDVLGLPRHTIKVGIMDEERRTSVNLRECIRAVRHRLVFINTGFLDRTGDEIHTSMSAGPVLPKGEIKDTVWLAAYEDNNVDQGIRSGLPGLAQIGKGMWARPDDMAAMMTSKIAHPKSGASTAWVPSPTAATLHVTHYHAVDVRQVQASLERRAAASLDAILTPPLLGGRNLSEEQIARELDNNAQSILGYVVRWIDQGIGCSKVPDIDGTALMEDRATLRISSQHIANWLHHGIVGEGQVRDSFVRMASVVDHQNVQDPHYVPIGPDRLSFQAALALVFEGVTQPNGYTEPVLHKFRRLAKA